MCNASAGTLRRLLRSLMAITARYFFRCMQFDTACSSWVDQTRNSTSKPRIGCCMLQSMYLDPKLSLLSPNGPSRWYRYPPTPNIFLASITDILTVVEPRTTTGCSYSLAQNESKTATLKLKCLLIVEDLGYVCMHLI